MIQEDVPISRHKVLLLCKVTCSQVPGLGSERLWEVVNLTTTQQKRSTRLKCIRRQSLQLVSLFQFLSALLIGSSVLCLFTLFRNLKLIRVKNMESATRYGNNLLPFCSIRSLQNSLVCSLQSAVWRMLSKVLDNACN